MNFTLCKGSVNLRSLSKIGSFFQRQLVRYEIFVGEGLMSFDNLIRMQVFGQNEFRPYRFSRQHTYWQEHNSLCPLGKTDEYFEICISALFC